MKRVVPLDYKAQKEWDRAITKAGNEAKVKREAARAQMRKSKDKK